jgi:hypothetical protein
MAPRHLFAAEQEAALTGIARWIEAELSPLLGAALELDGPESQLQVEYLRQGALQGDRVTSAVEELTAALAAVARAGPSEPAWSPPVAGLQYLANAASGAEQLAGSAGALAAELDRLLYQG